MWRDHSLSVTNKHTTENYSNTERKQKQAGQVKRDKDQRERTETHTYIYIYVEGEGEIWIQVLSMTCMLITQINSGMVPREKKLQSKLVIKQVQEWESYRRNFTKRTFILC